MKASLKRLALVVGLAALTLAGCTNEPEAHGDQPDPSELRTDIEPIVGRVPTLGSDFTAQWFSNTTFDQRGQGPSTYWIHALITPADGLEDLVDDRPLSPGTPDVRDELDDLLPTCEWQRSDDIDRAWGPLDWETHVWFCQEHDQLVLSMLSGS